MDVPEAIMSQDPQVVGFSTMCNSYHLLLRLARRCKEINPEVQVIFGGPQASLTARETVAHFPQVDLVVRGEAENTIVEVMQSLPQRQALARLSGVTFKDGNQVIHTPPPEPIKDLDMLPQPDYGLLPNLNSITYIPIEVGRGCPFRCTFCSSRNLLGYGFRIRSPENLARLLKTIVRDYGIRNFLFEHDGFNIDRYWLWEFCLALNRENLDISWTCFSRIDCLDDEILEHLAAAGCKGVTLGIETGSQRMQKLIRKKLQVDRVVPTARLIMNHQIEFYATFIVGFPEESLEDMVQTIKLRTALNFVGGNRFKCLSLNLLMPFKGSQLYEEYGHSLGLDEFSSIITSITETEEDKVLIKDHPDIFSAFYHFFTPKLNRGILVRVPYLLKNLDKLFYTCFMLWQDPDLGFPLTLLRSPLLLELPGEKGGQGIGDLANLRRICRFIENVVRRLGFSEHPIFDVMKYDLAVEQVMRSEATDAKMVEEFSYDIIGLVEEIKAEGFKRLPAKIEKMDHSIYFYKKDYNVNAIRLPNIFDPFLHYFIKKEPYL